jgi:dTDP-4-dehydrorhamnose reductase
MKNSKILIIGKNGQLAQALLAEAKLLNLTNIFAFDRTELNVLDVAIARPS